MDRTHDLASREANGRSWTTAKLKYVARFAYGDSLSSTEGEGGPIPVFGSNGAYASTAEPNTLSPATLRMISDAAVGHYVEHCSFPPNAEPSSAIPEGGAKVLAVFAGTGWQALGVPLGPGERYFSYRTESSPEDFAVFAEADFVAGGPHHVSVIEVTGFKDSDGTCLAESTPSGPKRVSMRCANAQDFIRLGISGAIQLNRTSLESRHRRFPWLGCIHHSQHPYLHKDQARGCRKLPSDCSFGRSRTQTPQNTRHRSLTRRAPHNSSAKADYTHQLLCSR